VTLVTTASGLAELRSDKPDGKQKTCSTKTKGGSPPPASR
jgi:hypothetical protein